MAGDTEDKTAKLARSLRRLWERAGSPTYARIVRQGAGREPSVALSTTSLGDWFKGSVVPADPGRFAFLVTWLEHEAHRRDNAHVPTPVAAWERLRGEAVRERRPAGRPHTPRRGEPAHGGGGFVGRPVREFTDPFALEVHRAIDAPEHTRSGLPVLPVLPVYVPRDHDRVLREAVERAVGGESVMVTLVAGSSTGKTRACWEALQGVPDGWRLWHPLHPSPAEAAVAGLSRVGPRTVVWLNEAQTYLEPAAVGQRIATGLRELLDDPGRGPVLVLATLWPDPFWSALTTRPPVGDPDPHAQARALLTGTDLSVPDAFTGTDLKAVRARVGEDPRLANALASGDDGRVTQYLAGALALLKRYELAPPGGRSVIEAAMDARRLGHGPVLRQAFLEDAADAYLTDHESDALTDDWFEQALAYATNVPSVHGAVAPLTRIRPRRRTHNPPSAGGPTYRLADYLEQHARHTRGAQCPRASFWTAAHDHAHTTDDTLNLAQAALERLRLRHAERLFRKAANTRDPHVPAELAGLREQAGDHDGAEHLAREAADTGHPSALTRLAKMRKKAGDHDGAEHLYREAADAGHPFALAELAEMREEAGDRDGAERLAREAADAGATVALAALSRLRQEAGDHDGAERLAREAGDAGNANALLWLAVLRKKAGDPEGAERLVREAGDIEETLMWLAEMRKEAGDPEGAERLYREAANNGHPFALADLAEMREGAGDRDGAERLAREAADTGNTFALTWLAELRGRAGDPDGAERLYREAADSGDPFALAKLAGLWEKTGDRDGAERLAREAADAGNTNAMTRLAEMRRKAGDREGAERLRRGLDADNDVPRAEG
ncbi:tetratricopeptide repeat protein [Embleya sp. NPDC059267]|uniref:tetratricopeptide repeat protein n=1 Tax=Embleya sp. NPDC059267 TaxID=3346798 RepID=UPI003697753C